MSRTIHLAAAAAAILTTATPALARHAATDRPYTASYDSTRDAYCIRFFSGSLAADPRPGNPGITCQTRARWAQHRVYIQHRRPTELTAR
ncbi:hypothetical protein M9979_15135 [Sphingomonas sp. RP10(2022)]|uniref:Secreted protein n=1 Tax=Sphingomonas liriopis TaxID=2949094 RepID=A0A9X2HTC8_9SPHN|nr:hypothetical protein [Sphingomonas liriopis]MCP3736202.1 hypothetical protein [Sphingomonas liriopis]